MTKDGDVLPRNITGLCNRQDRIVKDLVAMSKLAGKIWYSFCQKIYSLGLLQMNFVRKKFFFCELF